MSVHSWPDAGALSEVAERAGVYLFRDREGKVLYVGKSANLRDRLRTYGSGGDGRVNLRFLGADARAVETIITRSESEALLLEDALIKEHQPPHNIRLKDDKSFLMIRVDEDERFPRLKFVRQHRPGAGKEKGRSRLFGPFASAGAVRATIADMHRVVPLRDCTDTMMDHRSRPCLKHQIGLCAAPCVGLIEAAPYAELVRRALRILSGDTAELERDLETRMREAAETHAFERAAGFRDRLLALRRTVERQGVLAGERTECDVFGLARAGETAVLHRLSFRRGRLAESRSHVFQSQLADEELVHGALVSFYANGTREVPAEIVLSCLPEDAAFLEIGLGRATKLVVPRSGERKRMLDLAGENARAELARAERRSGADDEAHARLAALVDLPGPEEAEAALVIDGFDVSNLQGKHVVASRVRFRGGIADRANYRRYRIRGVEGQDDFASMGEVVGRSLRRGLDEGDLPDLVLIDGGAEQLARALEARDEVGAWDLRIIALAKARSERSVKGTRKAKSAERVYLAPDKEPIELGAHDPVCHLLARIRDEAHRFAITYHRKERGRITSRLDSIPGIGAVRRKALLRRFGSVQGIDAASEEEIASVEGIGPELARVVREHLQAAPEG